MRIGLRRLARVVAFALPLALAACQTLIKPKDPCGSGGDGCPHTVCDPKVLHKPTVHAAASDLDHLEKHIDWHGSVVAKVPDVWGQARLTLYREQFEQQMEFELNRFEVSLQGSIARQDQAFLLNATAISSALETPVRPIRTQTIPAGRYLRGGITNGLPANPKDTNNIVVLDRDYQTIVNTSDVKPAPAVKLPGLVVDEKGTATADSLNVFTSAGPGFNLAAFQGRFLAPDGQALKIGLEPERYLEQKKRYLDLLAQIRRANEGDDTADSPGYSLQLFRIPVSVLPGKRTDVGHGAEITMTLTPVLGDDLLPITFRNLLTNDLLHQLGFPLTQILGEREKNITDLLNVEFQTFVRVVTQLNDYLSANNRLAAVALAKAVNADQDLLKAFMKYTQDEPEMVQAFVDLVNDPNPKAPKDLKAPKEKGLSPARVRATLQKALRRSFPTAFNVPTIGFAKGLDDRTAFPTSQLLDVYGTHAVFEVAFGAHRGLEKSIARQGYAHLPDVQAHLKEEVSAAYEFLRKNPALLTHHCTPELVQAIRTKRIDEVLHRRQAYRAEVAGLTGSEPLAVGPDGRAELKDPHHLSVTAALGWCLIVDAALLNDRLIRDARESATARGRVIPAADTWLPYFLPDPPPEARCAFNEYVSVRWPIHVFALDPGIQEQNLADRLATRRELQLALSLAFSHGFMSFNQLTRYARRLEAEYETIDLNRTQVGFAHGSDTFGWRFYPRYQTPDTPGNLTVIARDLIAGGPNRNQLLRERRLEPGPRECVALVIMPSFVSAVTLNTTSNFFGLANPKHKVFDHTQAVKLGRTAQAIKTAGSGLTDVHCYRDGDAARLMKRAEQLEARLPLQTVTFPVPTEGTLGGFEMFGTSTSSLSPELFGFYGAPGISAGNTANHLFLVGDHFSPLRTRVIVGNQGLVKNDMVPRPSTAPAATPPAVPAPAPATTEVKKMVLLSRQVMQVEIPAGLLPLHDKATGRYYYTVHVATPYGVSRELLVPAVCQPNPCPEKAPPPKPVEPPKPTEGYSLTPDKLTVTCKLAHVGGNKYMAAFDRVSAGSLEIDWNDATGSVPRMLRVLFEFEVSGVKFSVPCVMVGSPPGVPVEAGAGLPKNAFRLAADKDLGGILSQVIEKLGPAPFALEANPFAKPLTTKRVTVTPVADGVHAVREKETNNQLTIEFKLELDPACPPLAAPVPPPMPAPKPPPEPAAAVTPRLKPPATLAPLPTTVVPVAPTTPKGPPTLAPLPLPASPVTPPAVPKVPLAPPIPPAEPKP